MILTIILFAILMLIFCIFKESTSKIRGKQLCNTISPNQFKQTRSTGDLDLTSNPNPSVMTCLYYHASATLVPGEGVILTDLGASDYTGVLPIVTKRAADANAIEGVLIYDLKKATKSSYDKITVAKKGAVVVMTANAAINRGSKVALVLASPGYVKALASEALFGKTLDKALASGDLIRVEVLAEGVV